MKFWILNHVLFQFVFFPSWNLPCWATWSERQSTIQWPDYKFFRRLHTSIDESRIEMTKENNLGIFVGEVCFAGWSFSTAVTSAGDEISMLWLVLTKQEQEVCSYCAGPYRPRLDLALQTIFILTLPNKTMWHTFLSEMIGDKTPRLTSLFVVWRENTPRLLRSGLSGHCYLAPCRAGELRFLDFLLDLSANTYKGQTISEGQKMLQLFFNKTKMPCLDCFFLCFNKVIMISWIILKSLTYSVTMACCF